MMDGLTLLRQFKEVTWPLVDKNACRKNLKLGKHGLKFDLTLKKTRGRLLLK